MIVEFMFLVMAIVSLLAIVIFAKNKYPVKAIIFEKRENGYIIKIGRAGRITDRKTKIQKYKLNLPKFPFGEKYDIKPQSYKDTVIDDKGKSIIFLYSESKGSFGTLKLTPDKENMVMKILDGDMQQFQVHSYRDADTRYKGKGDIWARYGNVITLAVLAISIMLIFYGSQWLYSGAAENMSQASTMLNSLKAASGQIATPIGG
jgi:hypothetical protein